LEDAKTTFRINQESNMENIVRTAVVEQAKEAEKLPDFKAAGKGKRDGAFQPAQTPTLMPAHAPAVW
jgi:hypothetical protein